MPVTERIIIPVTGGVEAWKESVKFMLQTLKVQEGNIRTRWGPHAENEDKLDFLVGWESIEAQKKFADSPVFAEMMEKIKPITTGPANTAFIEFKPYAPPALIDSKFVQCITSSEDIRSKIEALAGKDGCNGVSGGWATYPCGKKDFVAVAGWDSMEQSKAAADAIQLTDEECHHVNFRFPVKGFRGL